MFSPISASLFLRPVVNSGTQWVKPRAAFYKSLCGGSGEQIARTRLLALPVVKDFDVFGDGLSGLK